MKRAVRGGTFLASLAGGMTTSPPSARRVAGDPGALSSVGSGGSAMQKTETFLVPKNSCRSCPSTVANSQALQPKGESKESQEGVSYVRAASGASTKPNEVESSSKVGRSSQRAFEGAGTPKHNSDETPQDLEALNQLAKACGLLYNVHGDIDLPNGVWDKAYKDLEFTLMEVTIEAQFFRDITDKEFDTNIFEKEQKKAKSDPSWRVGYNRCFEDVQKLEQTFKPFAQCVKDGINPAACYLEILGRFHSAVAQRPDYVQYILSYGKSRGRSNGARDALELKAHQQSFC